MLIRFLATGLGECDPGPQTRIDKADDIARFNSALYLLSKLRRACLAFDVSPSGTGAPMGKMDSSLLVFSHSSTSRLLVALGASSVFMNTPSSDYSTCQRSTE